MIGFPFRMNLPRKFVSAKIAECGCVEEEWQVAGLDVMIHFEEEDGQPFADCFVDAGDWDVENRHDGSMDAAREAAFQFIESWPMEK